MYIAVLIAKDPLYEGIKAGPHDDCHCRLRERKLERRGFQTMALCELLDAEAE